MSHHHWFTLEIEHEYFQNNECPVFELLPMSETLRIMKNYGMRFQKEGNRYKGHAEVRPSRKIWEELRMAEDLYFLLINTDQNFDNYTNVSLPKKEGTVVYVTNSEPVNRFSNRESVVPQTDLDIRSLRFNVKVSIKESVFVVVKNNQGQTIFNQLSQKRQSSVAVDISVFGAGIYELWIDDVLSSTFFGTSDMIHTSCYGVLHIQMRNVLESLKENTIPSLKVNFESRATFWEYVIIVSEDKKIMVQDMIIENEESEQYIGPEKRIVMGSKISNVFTSTNTIRLSQKTSKHSILKIKYTNHFSDTLLELDMKMPAPSVASIITKKENNEDIFYSQTIIYV